MLLNFGNGHAFKIMPTADEIDSGVIISSRAALLRMFSGPVFNKRAAAQLILEVVVGPRSADRKIQNLT